jgi:hypothetical protein
MDHEGRAEWKLLEDKVKVADLKNSQALIGNTAGVLITCFLPDSNQQRNDTSSEIPL